MGDEKEQIVSVQCHLNARDYDDVFRVYLEIERTREKKVTSMIAAILMIACIVLFFMFDNYSFLFYALVCVGIGLAYLFVPANKKFIATARLLLGEKQEISFYPYQMICHEIYEEESDSEKESDELSAENDEEGLVLKTSRMTAYENERGFLFSDGKISNLFLYVPKRQLDESQKLLVQDFAKTRCSGGYLLLEMHSLLDMDKEEETDECADQYFDDELTDSICGQYYGAKKLHLHDEKGQVLEEEWDAATDMEAAVQEENADE